MLILYDLTNFFRLLALTLAVWTGKPPLRANPLSFSTLLPHFFLGGTV